MSFNYKAIEPLVNPLLIVETPNGGLGAIPPATTNIVNGVKVPAAASLELQSTKTGFLPNRMTTAQRTAITPATGASVGLIVYDTTLDALFIWTSGNVWVQLAEQGGGSGALTIRAGSAAAPSLNFVGSLTTGIYSSAANTIDFTNNGVRQFSISYTAAAVNIIDVNGGATGVNPILGMIGSDANIGLDFLGKGTGIFNLKGNNAGNSGALAFWNSANSNFTALAAPSSPINATFVLPSALPTIAGNTPVTCNTTGQLTASSVGPMLYALSTTLTQAQITGLFGTPQVLIPAPGAGFAVVIHLMTIKLKKGSTTVYANSGSASISIRIQYGIGAISGATQATSDTPIALLTSSTVSSMTSAYGVETAAPITTVGNQPIAVCIDGSNLTGGNAADTLVFDMWYSVVALNS